MHVSLTPITTTRECVHRICSISKVYITYQMKTSCPIHLSVARSCLLWGIIGQLEQGGCINDWKHAFPPPIVEEDIFPSVVWVSLSHVNQILTRWKNPGLSMAHRFSCACKDTGRQKVTTNVTKSRWNRKSNTANLLLCIVLERFASIDHRELKRGLLWSFRNTVVSWSNKCLIIPSCSPSHQRYSLCTEWIFFLSFLVFKPCRQILRSSCDDNKM